MVQRWRIKFRDNPVSRARSRVRFQGLPPPQRASKMRLGGVGPDRALTRAAVAFSFRNLRKWGNLPGVTG